MQTLIRLLLQEQSDLGLHCLYSHFVRYFGVQNFRTFTVDYIWNYVKCYVTATGTRKSQANVNYLFQEGFTEERLNTYKHTQSKFQQTTF